MLHAFKFFTGPEDASHVIEGTVAQNDPSAAASVYFKETPPHSSLNWHDAPAGQYVITLSGTLEFTTSDGKTLVLRPADVLLAADNVATGHKSRLIDDQPWRRVYIVLQPGAYDALVPNK